MKLDHTEKIHRHLLHVVEKAKLVADKRLQIPIQPPFELKYLNMERGAVGIVDKANYRILINFNEHTGFITRINIADQQGLAVSLKWDESIGQYKIVFDRQREERTLITLTIATIGIIHIVTILKQMGMV